MKVMYLNLNIAVAIFTIAYASKPSYGENIESRRDISNLQVSGIPALSPIPSESTSRQGKRQEEKVMSKTALNKRTFADTDKDTNTEQPRVTEENFENFFEALKVFMGKASFDFKGFQTDLDRLQVTYDAIHSHFPAAPSESLLAQQRYVHEVFETIKHDSALARKFSNPQNRFHYLATQMLSMNLSLISLRDSRGVPNKGLKDQIFYFQNILRSRETKFSDLMYYREFLRYEDLAMPARAVYTQSLESIKQSLEEFISGFPKQDTVREKKT